MELMNSRTCIEKQKTTKFSSGVSFKWTAHRDPFLFSDEWRKLRVVFSFQQVFDATNSSFFQLGARISNEVEQLTR